MNRVVQRPIKILMADDNEDDILFVTHSFRDSRLSNLIDVVNDGVEALKYLRYEPPYEDHGPIDLVLLDINMPIMDGFTTLQEIKSDPSLKHLPIVMLTTSQRDEDVAKSFEAGACSYIQKPVDFQKMRKIVEEFSFYWTMVSRTPPTD